MSAVREVASNAPREAVTGSTREAGAGALWEAVCAEPEQWSAVQLQPAPGWEWSLSGASDLFNAPTTWGVVFVHPIFFVCLFYVVCVCVLSQSCLTLCNPMDCSLPDSSVHGIFQARILE